MDSATVIPRILFFLFALAVAGVLSFLGCRAIVQSPRFQALPRPVACALLWATPAALFLLSMLSITRHPTDILGASPLLLVVALVGLAYGGVFRLLLRAETPGYWYQRALVGGLLGLALALLCGTTIHYLLTGWGGPGGGGFRRLGVMEASLLFLWLVPLVAVAGIATPLKALMPNASVERRPSAASRATH